MRLKPFRALTASVQYQNNYLTNMIFQTIVNEIN